ncbi:probable methyltransferase TCM_000331 isoform X1 [Nicotiana sylvestris]|uniref:Benzoate carboxyl methyltransferase-like isoform X1 n=1 Tax=Nicotiana sylvestris TaxID=4096 RepID=A0A1U7YFA4_NICSY|nr:PREDICTED: benzoate carboxyl methyltransferase-like isoform X1 [Nicotiana sylvestris]
MVLEKSLPMTAGDSECSYANNSILQRTVIVKAKPVLEDTVKNMFKNGDFPMCFTMADLGCSSGPNTLLSISNVIDIVHNLCKEKNKYDEPPEFQVYLNDLPDNDFNSVFKSIPSFLENLKKEKGDKFGNNCYIAGVPGSFYERLFPSNSLNFVHSSYSLHWLSQVPKGLESNKGSIFISKSSPPQVLEAYFKQFEKDFSSFLHFRSQELISGGHMVLVCVGRNSPDPKSYDSCCLMDLLTKSLLHLAAEGKIKEDEIDSFNMPSYTPYEEEIKKIIQMEGSFTLERLEAFESDMAAIENPNGKHFEDSAKLAVKTIRAVTEVMLASHFETSIIDNLFEIYIKYVTEYLSMGRPIKFFNISLCLQKV